MTIKSRISVRTVCLLTGVLAIRLMPSTPDATGHRAGKFSRVIPAVSLARLRSP